VKPKSIGGEVIWVGAERRSAIIVYRIRADRLGDLDHETMQVLDRTLGLEICGLVGLDGGRTSLAKLVSNANSLLTGKYREFLRN